MLDFDLAKNGWQMFVCFVTAVHAGIKHRLLYMEFGSRSVYVELAGMKVLHGSEISINEPRMAFKRSKWQ